MRSTFTLRAAASLLTLAGAGAFAQADGPAYSPLLSNLGMRPDTSTMGAAPATRQERRSEFLQEQRAGAPEDTVSVGDDSGTRLREAFPGEVHPNGPSEVSRSQVRNDVREAQRSGYFNPPGRWSY